MKPARTWLTLAAMLLAAQTDRVTAQTFNVLHTFTVLNPTNTDGVYPLTDLALSDGTVYGATSGGGTNNLGTVFSIATDGSAFTVLHTFAGTNLFNTDGARPQCSLISSGDTLYGTASEGGTNNAGTLFSVATDGSAFTVLHTFAPYSLNGDATATNTEGVNPNSLVLSPDGVLYGTAKDGGTNGYGTLFSISTNGAGFTVLHTFKERDGGSPQSFLALADDTLYGTTPLAGTNGSGTIYSIATNGGNFSVLYSFTNNGVTEVGTYLSGLSLCSNTLYGTYAVGGTNHTGTVFSIATNGSGFTLIHTFSANGLNVTNLDGANPEGALALAGNTLYAAASKGGTNGWGTLFSVNTDGSGFNTLYAFPNLFSGTNDDGVQPETGLVLCGGTFYGTAYAGGANAHGTVFGFALMPVISSFNLAGTNLVLNATNGVAGETCCVLASTNVSLPLNQWTPITTNVVSVGGNFSITATNAVNPCMPLEFYTLKVE